jgi:hypothetical protein
MSWLKEKVITPKYQVLDALPTGASYGFRRKEYDKYVSVPMQSGKRALYRNESYTPHDPGDQLIYRFVFIRYLRGKR